LCAPAAGANPSLHADDACGADGFAGGSIKATLGGTSWPRVCAETRSDRGTGKRMRARPQRQIEAENTTRPS
jgi:hypothetical protein